MTRKKAILTVGIALAVIVTVTAVKMIEDRNVMLQDKISYYQKIQKYEKQWIMENQAENGAILTYEKKADSVNRANPYFANLAASALMEGSPSKAEKAAVRRYLNWYLSHINDAEDDPANGAGTIYDYELYISRTGSEKDISKRSYDSVDSYAATFLKAASDYVNGSGDTKWLDEHFPALDNVANALWRCMNSKGITFAKADYPIYYLMDNCETNAGLKAMAELEKPGAAFSRHKEVKIYLKKNAESIKEVFWRGGEFIFGLDENGQALAENGQPSIYPQTVAQIYPIAWKVLDQKEKRAADIYQKLCKDWHWEQMDYRKQGYSQSCWPVFAYVGALMGDEGRVETYVENYMEVVNKDHGYPVHVDDSAWIIKTCEEMKSYYQNQMITFF